MLNMLDDCSRVFVGSKLYERELLLSYLDFLPAAFLSYGRPLQIYVDYHAIFFSQNPDALTQLGAALKFYDISLLYAPTPQAKGKIEREHQYWQGRLPPCFASERLTELETANPHIDALRLHHNTHEFHRELRMIPQHAWELAKKEKRSVLRPAPRCPWWPYVWSVRSTIKVGSDGRVPIAGQRNIPQGPRWFSASIPPAITPSWPPHQTKTPNRCSCVQIAENEPVLVC